MEQPKKPNALAELMANSPNPANTKSNLSAATLKALERFGPGNASKSNPPNRPEPLPLPGTDWELWAHMPKATLREVVAVSLGIDPSALKPQRGCVEPGKDFEHRLKLACAFVSHVGPLKSLDTLPPNHLMGGPATATVSLPQFAAWALSMGWELPERFPRMKAAPRQPTTPSPAPVVPIEPQAAPVVVAAKTPQAKPLQRTAAQDAAILCEIKKQGYDPLALPKNPDGKPGVKASVRTALLSHPLFIGSTVFDKAWVRLAARADIAIRG